MDLSDVEPSAGVAGTDAVPGTWVVHTVFRGKFVLVVFNQLELETYGTGLVCDVEW